MIYMVLMVYPYRSYDLLHVVLFFLWYLHNFLVSLLTPPVESCIIITLHLPDYLWFAVVLSILKFSQIQRCPFIFALTTISMLLFILLIFNHHTYNLPTRNISVPTPYFKMYPPASNIDVILDCFQFFSCIVAFKL